jgi:hypothetical protein
MAKNFKELSEVEVLVGIVIGRDFPGISRKR